MKRISFLWSVVLTLWFIPMAGAGEFFRFDASGNLQHISPTNSAGAPHIRKPTSYFIADLGAAISLSAVSSPMSGALTYQWFFWGDELPGQTNDTLFLGGLKPEQLGEYHVTITGGSLTSAVFRVDVDLDHDRLPDSWEIAKFGFITEETGLQDADGDGVSNLDELLEGTDPNDRGSLRPRLTVFARGGTVLVHPFKAKYAVGESVTLTATPPSGASFLGWFGTTNSFVNPLRLTLTRNTTLRAQFGLGISNAVDAPQLVWRTGGDVGWSGQTNVTHDGKHAAQSGAIGHNQQSWMETRIVVRDPSELRFWWRVSAEAGKDDLRITINGGEQGKITGTPGWADSVHFLPPGTNIMRWTYSKDSEDSFYNESFADFGWVDQVQIRKAIFLAPANVTVAEGAETRKTNALVKVKLGGSSTSTVSVNFQTIDGSARSPSDYLATNGTLVFPPGTIERVIPIVVRGDLLTEESESFHVVFSQARNAFLLTNRSTVTISNDDGIAGKLHHLEISPIGVSPRVGEPFSVTITAKDVADRVVTAFNGYVSLTIGTPVSPNSNAMNVAVSPDLTGPFVRGVWTGQVTAWDDANDVVLTARHDDGYATNSTRFTVRQGEFVDFTPPRVTITSPPGNITTTNSTVTLAGTASDNLGLRRVEARMNGGAFVPAVGRTKWSFSSEPLSAGTNRFEVKAVDVANLDSAFDVCSVFRSVPALLGLSIVGAGRVTPYTNQQRLEIGRNYALTAVPNAGWLFSGWQGTTNSAANPLIYRLPPSGTLTVVFVTNRFPSISGTHSGLFYPTNGPIGIGNAGAFQVSISGQAFSGQLRFAGYTLALSGKFPAEGAALVSVPRASQSLPPLSLILTPDFALRAINGTLREEGGWSAAVYAEQTVVAGALAGDYTVVLPGAEAGFAAALPVGDGVGTVGLAASGNVSFAGSLGDGTAVSQGTTMGRSRVWPVFAPLASGNGMLLGWARFDSLLGITASNLVWQMPGSSGSVYQGGFSNQLTLTGKRYVPPAATSSPFGWTRGFALLEGGNLPGQQSNVVVFQGRTLSPTGGVPGLNLTFTPASGLFSGSLTNPGTGRVSPVKGVVLQAEGTNGYGWFTGTNQSGYLNLHPLP